MTACYPVRHALPCLLAVFSAVFSAGCAAGCAEVDVLPADPSLVGRLALPWAEPERISGRVGVDHDPAVYDGTLANARCADHLDRSFPHCYDEHDGTDFLLAGGFPAMDDESATVLAAIDGVVVAAVDGHYDRCHATLDGVSCDGHDGIANAVTLAHPGGWRTLYWHLMSGSVAVRVGQRVRQGDPLGRVGSSGYSSLPHLHFEVQDPTGAPIDPFAGPRSQPETLWCDPGAEDGIPNRCDDDGAAR